MGWFYPKKKSADGFTGQSMATVSLSPTLHLAVIFGIVISLLWISHNTAIYFQLLLLVAPILFILLLLSYSTTTARLNFGFMRSESLKPAGIISCVEQVVNWVAMIDMFNSSLKFGGHLTPIYKGGYNYGLASRYKRSSISTGAASAARPPCNQTSCYAMTKTGIA
ncbi:hypothetical protein VNO77_39120 [Canavalia gladiata]|uniref:Uncharacterized protein n=1 Tax=Canavalia gladiata TaxID=3824 RepID=A0AAN9K9X2_CANGL